MKNLSTISKAFFAIAFLVLSCQTLLAEKFIQEKYLNDRDFQSEKTVSVENMKTLKSEYYKQGSVNFVVFDSLANTYSYGNMMTNKAIKYSPYFGKLVTVKRGFYDLERSPTYLGDNSKNNLFMRISENWGKNWLPEVKVYDTKISLFDEARYPSVDVFEFESEFSVAYNSPRVIEKQSIWSGHILGFWNETYGAVNLGHSNDISGFNELAWGIDSRVLADHIAGTESFFQFVVGRVSPKDESSTGNANNIGWRKSVDLALPTGTIPPQWASNKFRATEPGYRSNSLVDLKKVDGDFYLAVFGGFEGFYSSKNSFGVSKSTDLGETWTEFNILPWSVISNFVSARGMNPDSSHFYYTNKAFVVLDNGQYSFAATLSYRDASVEDYRTIIVEIIYDQNTQQWAMYEIYTLEQASYIVYADVTNTANQRTNPNDYELDMVRTVDGSTLLAKWIEIIGYNEETGAFSSTDVFVATRKINSPTWSAKQNITNSEFIDRMTLLPDMIPDDLIDIPLFKMITITPPNSTQDFIRGEQFYALKDQWLAVGHFNAVVGILDDEEPCEDCILKISKIQPNPNTGDGIITITIWMPREDKADISIYDASGKLIDELAEYDQVYKYGANTIEIDFKDNKLPVGSYYINVVAAGQKKTKLMTIMR